MLPYFATWLAMALPALEGRRWRPATTWALVLAITLLVGLRDGVGGDWGNYLPALEDQLGQPLRYALESGENGYALTNWLAGRLNLGIYGANTICALIFSAGLVIFSRAQPRPWLALTLAVPYLVTVVAMGYTRQGVAIGLAMLGLLALERAQLLRFLAWIALAATFHRTVLVLLVLPAASITGEVRFSQLLRLALLAGAGYGLYAALLVPNLDYYTSGYLDAGYQSSGALIRVTLNLLPAVAFLFNRRRFGLQLRKGRRLNVDQLRLWTLMSLLAVLAFVALRTVASSTAVDRIALYLIPLQLWVGSRLPDLRLFGWSAGTWQKLLVLFSLAVLTVWLFFADHSRYWIPYRNILWPF